MTRTPRRILVLDNDGPVRQFLADLLTEEGHRVETAASVSAVYELMGRWQPDLLITDLSVWPVAPPDLPALLAADARFRDLPVVICTAALLLAPETLLAHAPGLEVVIKPFDVEDLLAAIDRLVARRGEIDPSGGAAD